MKYTEKTFEKFIDDNSIEDDFGLFDFIKSQHVNLSIDDEGVLSIKIKLIEK